MNRFAAYTLLVVLFTALLAVQPAVANAQGGCDPTVDPTCDPFYDDFQDVDIFYCDAAIDPFCDPNYVPEPGDPFYVDPFICDSAIDPFCDPNYVPEPGDPFYDDPFFCDAAIDPFCDPNYVPSTIVPAGEDFGSPSTTGCNPNVDPSCVPDELVPELQSYCVEFSWDPICDVLPSSAGDAPGPLAFAQPTRDTPAEVATRADTSDDVAPDELPPTQVPAIAANRLVLVVDALAELGAIRRDPNPAVNDAVRQLRDDIPSDGLTEAGYRDEVRRFAQDLPAFIDALAANGETVSPALLALAETLNEESLDELDDGQTSLFTAAEFFAAVADLSLRNGAPADGGLDLDEALAEVLGISLQFAQAEEPVAATTTTTTTTTTVAPTTTAVVATTAAPAPVVVAEPEPQGVGRGIWIGIGSAIGIALLALFAVLRRGGQDGARSGRSAEDGALSVNDLLDANRRLTASLDTREVAAIALAEAKRIVEAEGGVVVMRDGDALAALGAEPNHFFNLDQVEQSSLRRVVETGRSVATIASDDPILVEVPVAMAAVPIVTDGSIAGTLMVVRLESKPFGRDELEALEMLAPLIGSAVQASVAHGSATALADVEPMTGLKNRRRLDKDLNEVGADDQVAYIMVDVDHFKNFNDVNGHAAGDEALRQVANALAASVRPGDVVYRYGGEEFCVLLPATANEDAAVVAERARAAVESCDIAGGENQPAGRVTISVGVADTAESKPVEDLVERADAALYEAKHSGRNQVTVES